MKFMELKHTELQRVFNERGTCYFLKFPQSAKNILLIVMGRRKICLKQISSNKYFTDVTIFVQGEAREYN